MDNDDYIDAIYLVYTCPVNYEDSNSLYWAFTNEYYTSEAELYDGVEGDFYVFMGYDFVKEKTASGRKLTYNTETIIHESGHLYGLDDYYDYDDTKGPSGGIGKGDMMDHNVGDHNPFSKAILGWITPQVIDSSRLDKNITITLNSFAQSGKSIIICNGWNNTYFDEYYIIDFYTPTGLNALEAGYSGLFSQSGVRIYHIDARLKSASDAHGIWEIYRFNNTDTSHKLIKLVEADNNNDIERSGEAENDDLFHTGEVFRNVKWYDNTNANFEIVVNSIMENPTMSSASITIRLV